MTLIISLFEALCDFLFVSFPTSSPSLCLHFVLLLLFLFPLHFSEKRLTGILLPCIYFSLLPLPCSNLKCQKFFRIWISARILYIEFFYSLTLKKLFCTKKNWKVLQYSCSVVSLRLTKNVISLDSILSPVMVEVLPFM